MNYMSPIEQELESILNTEVDLEPVVIDAEDDGLDDQLVLLEQLADDVEEDDYPEVDLEPYDSGDWGESFPEGARREKANQSRSMKNRSRSMTNGKNIRKINSAFKKAQKKIYLNAKQIKVLGKRQRIQTLRNGKAIKRLNLDQKRLSRAVKLVNRRSMANTGRLDQANAMALPKAIGAIFSVAGQTDLAKILPSVLAELSVLIPPTKKLNRWAIAGITSAVVGAGGLLLNNVQVPVNVAGGVNAAGGGNG